MLNKHIEWVDVTKGLLITLVVLGHIIADDKNLLQTWIYSFHIPAFFMINGILKRNSNFLDKYNFRQVLKKQKKVWYTYLFFSFIFIARIFIQYKLGMYNVNELKTFFLHFLLLDGIGVLWFLPTFQFSEIIFYLCKKYNKGVIFVICLIIILLIKYYFFRDLKNIENVNNIETLLFTVIVRSFVATSFTYIGFYVAKLHEKKWFNLIGTISILFLLNGNVDLNNLIFNNIILYYLNALSGTILIIIVSKMIEKIKLKNIFVLWGKNSLLIMLTHSIFLIMQFSEFLSKCIFKNQIKNICCSLLLTMFLETLLIYAWNYQKKINNRLIAILKQRRDMVKNEK